MVLFLAVDLPFACCVLFSCEWALGLGILVGGVNVKAVAFGEGEDFGTGGE